ncbi:hypothetical protein ACWDKQ_18715 [Saccharopolyspora sp. NPDC000995]
MPQPPGTGTLAEHFRALESRIDELARGKAKLPACVVRLTSNVNLAANVDTWSAFSGMVHE